MIYQNTQTENTQNQFSNAFRELQLGKLLRKANITKNYGILNILAARNHKSGNLEISVLVLGNRLFCA